MDAVDKPKNNSAVLFFSYEGKYYSCDRLTSSLFKVTGCIDGLEYLWQSLYLMYWYSYLEGTFLANKEMLMKEGIDNKNIYGWGIENAEWGKNSEFPKTCATLKP